jgi:hypothetical protein
MTRRFLFALVVAAGLAGCGGGAGNEKAPSGTAFHDVTVTHNADSTFTLESQGQTISGISSVRVNDQDQANSVQEFLAAPAQKLCCDSCSLSGGVLICTGCTNC